MQHPYVSLENVFTFLWCLWKSRNDNLFGRRPGEPMQIFWAAQAINSSQALLKWAEQEQHISTDTSSSYSKSIIKQGETIKSDLLITGTKVFSDASWNNKKVPTGIGIHIQGFEHSDGYNVMIQASTTIASSPLQAEALALLLAAHIANLLNIGQVSFLTDNLTLARAAAQRSISLTKANWEIRKELAEYVLVTKKLQPKVFHISRELNGVSHNCAHQVLNHFVEPTFSCVNSAHRNKPCPVLQNLQHSNLEGFVIHTVNCL